MIILLRYQLTILFSNMEGNRVLWDTNISFSQHYRVHQSTLQRITPLWDQNIYNGWKQITSAHPITPSTLQITFQIQKYARKDSRIYFGVISEQRKQEESSGLGGKNDSGCLALMSWNEEKVGKIRVDGEPYCQESGELFVEEGGRLTISFEGGKQAVVHNEMTTRVIRLPSWFLSDKIFIFVTMTHEGDRVMVEQDQLMKQFKE